MKRIRVVETVIHEYEPDFAENAYRSKGIQTTEEALKFDKDDYDAGRIFVSELCYNTPTRAAVWSIVDD